MLATRADACHSDAAGPGLPRPVGAASRRLEISGLAQRLRAVRGEERLACYAFVTSDFGRLSRYAEANRALAAGSLGRVPGRLLRRLDYRPVVPAAVGRILSRAAVRQSWHWRADDRADAAAVPGRRAGAVAERRGDSGRHQRSGRKRGPGHARPVDGQPGDDDSTGPPEGIRVVLASILPVADDKTDANGQPLIRSRGKPLELLKSINARLAQFASAQDREGAPGRSTIWTTSRRWPRPPAPSGPSSTTTASTRTRQAMTSCGRWLRKRLRTH